MKRDHIRLNAIDFIDRTIKLDEKGEPCKLTPYQRRVVQLALNRTKDDALFYRLVLLSEPKKSGKAFMAACLCPWWAVHQSAAGNHCCRQ